MTILIVRSPALWRGLPRSRPHPPFNFNSTRTSRRFINDKPEPTKHVPFNKETAAKANPVPVPTTIPTLPFWQRLGPLSWALQAYGKAQRVRPLRTQFITSLVIYTLGDLSAQTINGEPYDPSRTLRALVISAGSSIPSYRWFMFLNNNFNYASKALSLMTKVVVNQVVFTPIFNTYFFGMQSLLAGDSLPMVWDRIQRTVPTSMINSCKLWPAVTAFSFTFIDPHYRSVFAGVIAIGWQTYLSYLNRRAEVDEINEAMIASASKILQQGVADHPAV